MLPSGLSPLTRRRSLLWSLPDFRRSSRSSTPLASVRLEFVLELVGAVDLPALGEFLVARRVIVLEAVAHEVSRTQEQALVGLGERLLDPASREAGEEQGGEGRAHAESRLHCIPLCVSVVDTLR